MPSKISPADFLQQTGVDAILQELQTHFKQSGKPLIVSDVKDAQGNQYVDLVQEGGGVLGIALVGYTYVLEKMGIRFFSMAGTSAGAINTMLLACAGNKEEEKSSKIVEYLVALDMFSFVDGKSSNWRFTKWIKRIIQKMLLGSNVFKKISRIAIIIVLLLLLLTAGCFVINFIWPGVAKWIGLGAGLLLIAVIVFIFLVTAKFKEFAREGYGLNEGKVFHNWIKEVISTFHVRNDAAMQKISNLADFSYHFMRVPKLEVTEDKRRENNDPPHMPMLTLITCDIIANRKIEFTQMWDLYWKNQEDVHPGDFVRASMSIPVFFETYTLTDISKKSSFDIWDKHLNWQNQHKRIPDKVQFIDGGTLSNFPINVFYNPRYPVPRMPTFGIRLQDGVLDAASRSNNSLFKYVFSLFSTIRFNFDRDFITKNRAFNFGVKNIDVQDHSWLNFFMKDEEKITLFRKGAMAAAEFLKTFDWTLYKDERLKNFTMHQDRFDNPNNLEVFPFSDRNN
jgi:NTE family protein